jgi:hypothetical protein
MPAPLVPPEDHHSRCFAIASIIVGRELAQLDRKAERQRRKMRVVACRVAELIGRDGQAETPANPSRVKLEAAFNEEQAVTFAVDLAFGKPYAPYELHYSEREFMESLRRSAPELHLDRDLVERVLVLKGEAMGAHSRIFASRWKLALAGVSSAVAIPFVPAFVGAAAGVAGVELLRAGSLAMGGLRLATGGWLVAGVKSAASSSAKAGARKLVNVAPAAAVRVEVAKWQTRVALLAENGCWSKDDVAGQLERLEETAPTGHRCTCRAARAYRARAAKYKETSPLGMRNPYAHATTPEYAT